MPKRPDAELVKTSKLRELEFYMMRGRNESIIFYDAQIDLTDTYKFLEKVNKNRSEEERITLFHVFLASTLRSIALRHRINRFVAGRRLWQRNQILFSFIVKKEKTEDGAEVSAMIEFDPFWTIEEVQREVDKHIYQARTGGSESEKDIKLFGAMPRWMINAIFKLVRWMDNRNMPLYFITKDVPLWCTIFLAHLGSIGIDSVYHHLYELGNAGVFISIGKIHYASVVNQETKKAEVKKVMDMRVSIDDRIASGSYTGPTIQLMQNLMEHPERLMNPPELTDEQLDKLMLKKYKKERLAREKARKKERRRKKKARKKERQRKKKAE